MRGLPSAGPEPVTPTGVTDRARLTALRETSLLDAVPDGSFDRFTRLATRLLGVPTAMVSLVDADRQVLLGAEGVPEPWGELRETPLSHSFCQHVVDREGPLVVSDARTVPLLAGNKAIDELQVVAYAGMPLTTAAGHTLGSLCAIDSSPRTWSQDDLDALADLAATVMAEVELRRLARRLQEEVRVDDLTGLPNRRALREAGPAEIARARRFAQPLVLAILDLDRFRRFNDRHGSPAGDDLLRRITGVWTSELRDIDVLARLGGEEFALILPATGLDPAFDVVERLRGSLTSGLTCSAGIAGLRTDERLEDLLARADAALVRAKRSGRNASVLAA